MFIDPNVMTFVTIAFIFIILFIYLIDLKYKKDTAYRGNLPLTNVAIDLQYNPDLDLLNFLIIAGKYKLNLSLTKKMRDQLIDALRVEYDPS